MPGGRGWGVGGKDLEGDFYDLVVWGSNFLGECLTKYTGDTALTLL